MVDLEFLKFKYGKSCRYVFEDMATRLFMRTLCLSEAPIRRPDKEGIESDPVVINSDVSIEFKAGTYAYQAKYYDSGTIISKKKNDFLKSIWKAKDCGVTDLMFYINIDYFHENAKTGKKSRCEIEIEELARNNNISLHWFTKDRVELMLDEEPLNDAPDYRPIRNIFFSSESSPDIYGFYEYICNELAFESGNKLFGQVPLLDNYIEPYLNESDNDKQNKSVRNYIESWISENDGFITVICGEPGHGKTSLCRKAVYDFYKKGWLLDKVDQVFCFSLNPAGTLAISNEGVRFDLLLSWGDGQNRSVKNNQLGRNDCKNSLVFFDGFDEFLEWMPEYHLYDFINDFILDFQKYTNAYIVITSRKMVINPNVKGYSYKIEGSEKRIQVPIKELSPITKEQQYEWIKRNIHRIEELEPDNSVERRDLTTYLEKYQRHCESLKTEDDLGEILGIPIIFRMIVASRYIPSNNSSLAEIYVNLFHFTWERHRHKKFINGRLDSNSKEMITNKRLAKHALKIFADNNETAEAEAGLNTKESTWLYSFYTENRGKQRVGFWHRTFYEYFLAVEIISWFASFAEDGTYMLEDDSEFRDMLSCLSRRRLNSETLFFIRDLYNISQLGENSDTTLNLRKEGIAKIHKVAFVMAYRILKETDGIMELPVYRNKNYTDKTENRKAVNSVAELIKNEKSVTPFIRGNNVYWNVVAICGICGYPLLREHVNEETLRHYDMSGCWMNGANLSGCYLREAHFENAHLDNSIIKGSDLKMINLTGAHLKGAKLHRSNISFATLFGADLEKSYFVGADLTEVDFRRANLSDANLELSDLTHADLRDATLIRTKFLDLWSKYHLYVFEQPRGEFDRLVYRSDIGRGNSGYIRRRVQIDNTIFTGAKLTREDSEILHELGIDAEKEGMQIIDNTRIPLPMSKHVRIIDNFIGRDNR